MDILLFGGLIGSLFSFLQFLSSPWIGRWSDRYGRRRVLLLSMIGNALSMALWVFAKSFSVFVLSRIVGGLTEGNVQMSIAMISDLTPPETRSKHLVIILYIYQRPLLAYHLLLVLHSDLYLERICQSFNCKIIYQKD